MAETSQSPDATQPTAETFVNAAPGIVADVGVNLFFFLFLVKSLVSHSRNFRMTLVSMTRLHSQTLLPLHPAFWIINMRMVDVTMHTAR